MQIRYVNVYLVRRLYGGPEEGGWYYDHYKPVKSMPTLAKKAKRLARKVGDFCERVNDELPRISSVLSRGVYSVRTEDCLPKEDPTHPPHYE